MPTYQTFLRSANSFAELASAEKIIQETGLSYSEAQDACREFNAHRTESEKEAGTKMEFTEE